MNQNAETLEQMPAHQQAACHGTSYVAISFTHVRDREVSYRAEASDAGRMTQDCGSSFVPPKDSKRLHAAQKKLGKLQKVSSIAVASCDEVLLFVSCLQDVQADLSFTGGSLVRVRESSPNIGPSLRQARSLSRFSLLMTLKRKAGSLCSSAGHQASTCLPTF